MEKARINKNVYGETGLKPISQKISVKVRNSGKKRPVMHKGFIVQIIPSSSTFEGGVEYIKVITDDGRMFRIKKEDIDVLTEL